MFEKCISGHRTGLPPSTTEPQRKFTFQVDKKVHSPLPSESISKSKVHRTPVTKVSWEQSCVCTLATAMIIECIHTCTVRQWEYAALRKAYHSSARQRLLRGIESISCAPKPQWMSLCVSVEYQWGQSANWANKRWDTAQSMAMLSSPSLRWTLSCSLWFP